MAQDQTKFDYIIKQLVRVNEFEQETRAIVQKQKKNEQKQQENVTKKLPTILTSSEKRRYQEIGKRFLLGAEVQFNNIKKGIKIREMMKTSKDFFIKGFQKIKEKGAQLKKSNFWKMLLGSLVVIGMAAYLFRDKIVKLLPDVTGQTGNIFQKVMKIQVSLMKQVWQFITTTLLGGVNGIVNRLFNDSIPKMLQIFFYETLPSAIFNTYLLIMSMFDTGATQYAVSADTAAKIDNTISSTNAANNRNQEIDEDDIDFVGYLKPMGNLFGRKMEDLEEGQRQMMRNHAATYLMYYQDVGEGNNKNDKNDKIDMAAVRKSLTTILGISEEKLKGYIKSGQFDVEVFMREMAKQKADFKKAIKAATVNMSEDNKINVDKLTPAKQDIDEIKNFGTFWKEMMNDVKYVDQLNINSKGLSSKEQERFNAMKQVYDNMNKIFVDKSLITNDFIRQQIVNKTSAFMDAASKFMSSEGGLANIIKDNTLKLSEKIATTFKDFFVKSFGILSTVSNGLTSYLNPKPATNNKPNEQGEGKPDVHFHGESQNGTALIINVDLNNNNSVISEAVENLKASQDKAVEEIVKSSEILETINSTLVGIGDIHGVNMQAWNVMYKLIQKNMKSNGIVRDTKSPPEGRDTTTVIPGSATLHTESNN